MSKYEITTIRSMDNEVRYLIYNNEEHAFFAGYDFMGSVNWVHTNCPGEECELTVEDDPEQIVRDLESADEEPLRRKEGRSIRIMGLHHYDGGLFMGEENTVEAARKIIDDSNSRRIKEGWIKKPELYQISCLESYRYEHADGTFDRIETVLSVIERYPR